MRARVAVKNMWRALLSLTLVIVMVMGMVPIKADAAGNYTTRLVDTSISLSLFPVHYIVYEYGGVQADSRSATYTQNYNAWNRMNDSDKAKVTKWYAGFTAQLEKQFGTNNYQKMLKWANEHNGWEDAGNQLRNRLASKNYEELYNYYGEPDNPNEMPVISVDLGALSQYSTQERLEIDSEINDYQVAYQEGLDAYQKLIKLKQEQTNIATTAITSDLIQIIVDNMVVSSPLSPGGSLDDLKDAAMDLVDQTFEISETFKKSNLYKYTTSGIRDYLTGNDERIDSKEAAIAVAMYWKLLAAREDYAQAGYLTCTRMYKDITEKYNAVVKTDNNRVNQAAASKKAIEDAHKKSVEEGVAFLADLKPEINVNREAYYKTDSDGNKVFDTDAYNKACSEAARAWASSQMSTGPYMETYDSYVANMKDFFSTGKGHIYLYTPSNYSDPSEPLYTYTENGTVVEERPEELYYRIFRKHLRPLEREDQHPITTVTSFNVDGTMTEEETETNRYYLWQSAEDIFGSYDDYGAAVKAVEAAYEEALKCLKEIRANYNAALEAAKPYYTEFITDTQPARNNIYTLCYGVNEDYGAYSKWGLGEGTWNSFADTYSKDLQIIEDNINYLVSAVDACDAEIDKVKQVYAEFDADRKALEDSLPDTYRLCEQAQNDMIYGMDEVATNVAKLQGLWDSFPAWVNDINSRRIGGTLISTQTLYKESFKGLEQGSKEYMAKIGEIINYAEDIPDTESSYIEKIKEGDMLWRKAYEKQGNSNVNWDIALNNLVTFCGGKPLKTNDYWKDYYNIDEYYSFVRYNLHEKCGDLRNLVNDLKGESLALANMKELYYESISKRGDWLRAAKTGERSDEFVQYMYKVGYPYATNNSGVYSCRSQAEGCSYTPWTVEEYYEKYVKPIFADVEKVLYGEKEYKEVKDLKPNRGDEIQQDSVDTYDAPETVEEDSLITYNDDSSGDDSSDDDSSETDDVISMVMGEKKQLEVVVEPADATYPELIWESDRPDIATVDEDGLVEAIAPGTAVITATALDSPSDAPISVSFTVKVTASENYKDVDDVIEDMKEGEVNFSLVNESLKLNGNKAVFKGSLVYVGDEYYSPVKVICALYDGDRFVGSSVADEELASGEVIGLSASISLGTNVAAGLTAKIFIVDEDALIPIKDYVPLETSGDNTATGEVERIDGAGIYNVSKVDASALEEGSAEYVDQNIIDKISLSVLTDSGDAAVSESITIYGSNVEGFYEGASKLRLTYSDAVEGSDYMVMVLTGKTSPSAGNIAYVSQKTASGGEVAFDINPEIIRAKDYYIYLSGGNGSGIPKLTRVGGFMGYVPEGEEAASGFSVAELTLTKTGRCEAGEEINISCTITMSDNAEFTKEQIDAYINGMTWESSNQDVVPDGNVWPDNEVYYGSRTAVFTVNVFTQKSGTATITGTAPDGLTVTCKVTVTEPIVIEPEVYSITYDLDGGTLSAPNPDSYSSESSETLLKNPTKPGYKFVGWTGTDLVNPVPLVIISPNMTGDLFYKANWEKNEELTLQTYTITYDLDGGDAFLANPTEYTSDTENFTLNPPAKNGYTFAGWTGSNGNTPETIVTIWQGTTGNLNYKANWIVNDDGGDGGSDDDGTGTDGNSGSGDGGTGTEENSGSGNGTGIDGDGGSGNGTGTDGNGGSGNDGTGTDGNSGSGNDGTGTDGNSGSGSGGTGNDGNSGAGTVTTPKTGIVETSKDGAANYKVTASDSTSGAVEVSYEGPIGSGQTKITVPEKVTLADGSAATVTSISAGAFSGNKKLTVVNIPSSVETIGDNAFKNCTKLKKVTIPKNVKSIGKNSFAGCSALTSVTFKGTKVTLIGNGAFSGCKSLKSIVIPKGVKKIGKEAFKNCKKLTKITVKSTTISSIGKKAFKGVPNKAKASLPKKQKKAYTTKLKKAGFKGKVK